MKFEDDILLVPGWCYTIAYGILIPVFAWTFYKVWYGTRNKVLLWLAAFLVLASVSYCTFGVSFLMIYFEFKRRDFGAAFT